MPETDILNPAMGWDPQLGDSLNPSYGFTRKRAPTRLATKGAVGYPWTRETQNTGHSFQLSWIGRTLACVKKLKKYHEQYENGYFTIVDWDGGARQYVGRFTGDWPEIHTANAKWDIQNLVFEEIPTVPMVQYPNDWDHDAILCYVNNDKGEQNVAGSGAFAPVARVIQGSAVTTLDDPGTAGDWAQYEYRGYGFRLYLMSGPEFGQCQVQLDGVPVMPDNTASETVDCYAAADVGAQMLCQVQNVSLDFHRVKLLPLGTKNVAATAATVSWHSLEVMR